MKAMVFRKLGGPEVLALEDVPEPVPPPGGVLVQVRAAGVNFADTRFIRGTYFVRPRFPQIPGMEAAGEVVALGEGATAKLGDRVMLLGANAFAERMIGMPDSMFPIPDGVDFATAASLPVQAITAHHCLGLAGRLAPGERVLVHAAAGGVGSLAVQLAKQLGASQVIATASSPEKLALATALGADVVIDYTKEDLVARVKEATGGAGVDVLLEMLGGTEALKNNLACLGAFGRMIVFGAASGDTKGTIEPISLMPKNQSVIGYYLTPLLRQRDRCAPALAEVAAGVAAGKIRVVLGGKFPLADTAAALTKMEQRGTMGKIVLEP